MRTYRWVRDIPVMSNLADKAPPVLAERVESDNALSAGEEPHTDANAPSAGEEPHTAAATLDLSAEQITPETLARTIISILGEEVDITDSGIDLEFLQALPDDMRADVVEQHMREQDRRRLPPTADIPEAASQISPEFLDALPPEIRAEVIMQEALETARRARAQEAAFRPRINNASALSANLLTPLGSNLREAVPPGVTGGSRVPVVSGSTATQDPSLVYDRSVGNKRSDRESYKLLDKPGISSLVRLLFFPEAFRKGYLLRILVSLCENTTTRFDLLNLLVSIVQDGSGDIPIVDRKFQQMSLRTATTSQTTPKAKASDSAISAATPSGIFAHLQSEYVPTFIALRCFEALTYIVGANAKAVRYFLTEHARDVGLRKPPSKKGKGKERLLPQTKFPIVILLELLGRPTLMKPPGIMELLTSLLATITKPLASLKPDSVADDAIKRSDPETASAAAEIPSPTQAVPAAPVAAIPAAEATTTIIASSDLIKAPVIPPVTLRLIINCLTVGDCPSRTFSQTLVTMQNLSKVPDGKEVILQELRSRAQELGQVLQHELQDLADVLEDEAADLGRPIINNFSTASSSQAQLLRLLKTIEYLHLSKVDSDPPVDNMSDQERLVGQIHESFDFDPMWEQLGYCLSMIEKRSAGDQTALALLPIVEALMVVCKYRGRAPREVRSPSLPSSTTGEPGELFTTFTTTHRKILNAIVRNTPALLSGSFSLLIRNSRALEFDNKRNWFFQKLRRRREEGVHSGHLHLNVRRQYVFEDSFHSLRQRSGDEVKYGKLSVKFYNEDGIDAGGVTREWYSVLAQQIFDPNFGESALLISNLSCLPSV